VRKQCSKKSNDTGMWKIHLESTMRESWLGGEKENADEEAKWNFMKS
jgi:hypothetical protein